MKILHLAKYYPPEAGGVETYVRMLAEEQCKDNQVTVLACNKENKTVKEHIKGVCVIRIASPFTLRSAPICLGMIHALRSYKDADIIHIHSPNPIADLSYLVVKPLGKLIITYHMDVLRQRVLGVFYREIQKKVFAQARSIIVLSPNLVQVSDMLLRFEHLCKVVPYGIDYRKYEQFDRWKEVKSIREKYGDRLIIFIGRLVGFKGVHYLIEAMEKVSANLIIIGDGPMKKKLVRQANQSSARDRINFVSTVSNERLIPFYHAARFLVLPSIKNSETFGIVQVEAMACGKPVVSSDLPTGVTYVNRHEHTGIVVPPADADSLARGISLMLDRPDLCLKYGENAQKRVKKEFSIEIMVEKIHRIYES